MTLQPTKTEGDLIDVTAAIRVPGHQSIIVTEDAPASLYSDRWVGIGKLASSDPAPTVLLAGFTGGAHCCAWLKAIVPVAGKLKVLDFEAIDGEPNEAFPSDLDGDGTRDFLRQDDSFRYVFASGAGSFSPPVIFNIYKGQIIDVSTQPGFRPIWEDFAKVTRARCADRSDSDRNGACAAYAAAGARLGRFEKVIAEVDKMARSDPGQELPSGCSVTVGDDECPADKTLTFHSFGTALRWFLKAHGYTN